MPQLDPTWFASQLFWLSVCFVALYVMLSRMVLPPLLQIIATRSQTLAGDITAAQRLKSEAEQARADYEKTLVQARTNAQNLMNAAVAEQKAIAEAKGKELDKQIEQQLAAASRQIDAKKNTMMQELTPATAELATLIVEKLTQSTPGADQVSEAILLRAKGRR